MSFERLSKSEIITKVIAYTLLTIFTLIAFYPIVYSFSVSISGKSAYETGKILLLPKNIQFEAYKTVLADNKFWISYANTLYYTVFGTVWSMIISLTGAYALAKKRLFGRRVWNFLLVFTMWFSAGLVPKYLNYVALGVDNRLGIVLAFGIQAFNIILLRNAFEGIPSEIEEAAIIDGANEFQLFRSIYIPMSSAAIATVTLFYAIGRWNGYYWSMMLIKSADAQPLQVILRQKIETFQSTDLGIIAVPYALDSLIYAIIICSIIPILVIYPYIQKYFARGVNVGGVKG